LSGPANQGGSLDLAQPIGRKFRFSWLFFSLMFFISLSFLLDIACWLPAPVVKLPEEIKNFQGEASCYFRQPEKEGRFRLVFYFEPADKIRLEILNPFGGRESILWLNGKKAFLDIPRQKVCWQGDSGVITTDFLGGEISASEIIGIFLRKSEAFSADKGWELFYDNAGQIIGGKKGPFSFEIKEKFPEGNPARNIYFRSNLSFVRIKILKIKFNQYWKNDFILPSFSPGTEFLSWEDISKIWKR